MDMPRRTHELACSLIPVTQESDTTPVLLEPGRDYILGRNKSADIPIADEKSSRRHARLYFNDGNLCLEDLASANGTRLNGTTITSPVALKNDDLIQIGRSKFRVSMALIVSDEAQSWWQKRRDVVDAALSVNPPVGGTEQWMSGTLKTCSLVELLQLLATSQKSAVLTLKRPDAVGRMFIRDGQIVAATLNDRVSPQPVKNVFRMLRWKDGRFELTRLREIPEGVEIDLPTSALLLEGVQLADEMDEFSGELPGNADTVRLTRPCPVRLSSLPPGELDLLQLILEHDAWLEVLDHHEGTDLEAARLFAGMKSRGIVRTV